MRYWAITISILLILLKRSSTQSSNILPGESKWDCSQDHARHPSDPGKFLQSSGGFGNAAFVIERTCPTKFQEFAFIDGTCRCVYTPELRALLQQPCQVRLVPGNSPQEYEILVPSLDRGTIDELYVRRSCYSLLTDNVVDFFLKKGVNPLFFNLTGCRCDWTPESNSVQGRPVPAGEICERLVDQNFTSREVSSDEVGNWISIFPYEKQRDLTIIDDGTLFGSDVFASVGWGLMGADFKEINIVAQFKANQDSIGKQTIYSNVCERNGGMGGFLELSYSPVQQEYTLLFITGQEVTCTPSTSLGSYVEQNVQVMYSRGYVKMMVNGFPCDVDVLNPIKTLSDRRVQLSTQCPFQLGGSVVTDVANPRNYGRPVRAKTPLDGIFKRFMALRNCPAPPKAILDKIQAVQ